MKTTEEIVQVIKQSKNSHIELADEYAMKHQFHVKMAKKLDMVLAIVSSAVSIVEPLNQENIPVSMPSGDVVKMDNCAECGKPFEKKTSGKYCSITCQRKASNRAFHQRKKEKLAKDDKKKSGIRSGEERFSKCTSQIGNSCSEETIQEKNCTGNVPEPPGSGLSYRPGASVQPGPGTDGGNFRRHIVLTDEQFRNLLVKLKKEAEGNKMINIKQPERSISW